MSAVQAFNGMMHSFFSELALAFPDEKRIKGLISGFELACKSNAKLPLQKYMEAVGPHMEAIMARDESVFASFKDVPYLKEVNLEERWKGSPEGTKEAIWQYLQTLAILGIGVQEIPPEILKQAESMAAGFASELATSDNPELACLELIQQMMTGADGSEAELAAAGGLAMLE